MMQRSRLTGLAVGTALVATGCAAILDLGERPIDDDFATAPASDGGVADRRVPVTNDGGGTNDTGGGGPGDAAPTDAADGKIPCLGGRERAYYCDDFEGVALDSRWLADTNGATANVSHLTSPPGPTPRSGGKTLQSGYDQLPADGRAVVSFQNPAADGGPIAIRFAFYLQEDGWSYTNERVPFARLRTAGGDATLVFVPIANGDGKIELDVPSQPSVNVGATTKNTWACYQVVFDGTTVSAYLGNTLRQGPAFPGPVTSAEIGLRWPFGANAGASKFFFFDDAIVAPGPVSCF